MFDFTQMFAVSPVSGFSPEGTSTANLKQSNLLMKLIAEAYGSLAWYRIFDKDYKGVLEAAQKGLKLSSSKEWIYTNLALGHLLTNDYEVAEKVYAEWKDKPYTESEDLKLFKDAFLKDISDLKEEGISHKDFDKIVNLLEAE